MARVDIGRPGPGRIALYLTLTVISAVMIVPFVWMLLTSVKTPADIAAVPPRLLPTEWAFGNYADALEAAPFAT